MHGLDRRLVRSSPGVRAHLAVSVGLGLAAAAAVVAQAVLLARVMDRVFMHDAGPGDIESELAAIVLVALVRAVVSWGFEVSGNRTAATAMSALRARLVEQVISLRPTSLAGAPAGELAATAVQGVDGLEAYFSRYLPQLALAALVPVAVLAWVIHVDTVAAGIIAATVPLIPAFMVLIGRLAHNRTEARWRELAHLSGSFLDALRGLPTLHAFNRAEEHGTSLEAAGERYRRETMATLRVAFLSALVLELLAMLGTAMVAVVLGVRLAHGGLAFVDALTVLLLAPELYLPLRQLGTQYHSAAEGCAAVGRIFDIVDAPAAVAAPRVVRPVPDVARTTIRFDEVSFAYRDRAGTVLERLDLQLRPGELAALVGPSGAGKSTVAALLLRFVDPTAGRIVIGGANLRELDPEAWRERIAWVPQRPHLFAGTVAENVRLGAAHASDAAVADALAAARAEFVETLPDGVETRIGEGGRQLSAGEGRRIALARAFLRGAPLVILDEPTAHLDPHSAVAVMAAVERLTAGRTTLMIVHDPILARRADRVVELGATRRLAAA